MTIRNAIFPLMIGFSSTLFAAENSSDLSYVPRAYVSGFLGGNDASVGQGDLLWPIYQQTDRALFLYGQGRLSNNDNAGSFYNKTPYVFSFGLGFRQLNSPSTLFGAYLISDYNTATSGKHFWDIGPGFEALGKVWDFRVNSYFPINNNSWSENGFANQFGDYNYERSTGNEQFDETITKYFVEHAATGADAEVGRTLFNIDHTQFKAYLGGYYFNMQNSRDVNGGSLRLTIEPTSYLTFSAHDTYDNRLHNTFMLGVKIKLNDLWVKDKTDHDFSERLFDSIERNLGMQTLANSVPSTIKTHEVVKGEQLFRDHILFYDGTKTTNGTGTYEDPYSYLQYGPNSLQNAHDKYPDYTNIYLNSGNYENFANAGDSLPVHLYQGESIWGRTHDYKAEAEGAARPVLTNNLILAGDNQVDAIAIHHSLMQGDQYAGVTINGSNVTLNNDEIGSANTGRFKTGVAIGEGINNVQIKDSTITAYAAGEADDDAQIQATGVRLGNNSNLIVEHSTINATAIDNSGNKQNGVAYGIQADGKNDRVSINNSVISASGTELGNSQDSGNGYGILFGKNRLTTTAGGDFAISRNILNMKNSDISGFGNGDGDIGYSNNGYGILFGYSFASDWAGSPFANLAVFDNKITINSSKISGSGNHQSQVFGGDESGNGYGLAVGYGAVAGDAADFMVHDNNIVFSGKNDLTGIGFTVSGEGDNYYAGNGYGLLVGAGSMSGDVDVKPKVDNNYVAINTSLLQGIGNSVGHYHDSSGNGYGMIVGYGSCRLDIVNSEVFANQLLISNSTLIGKGNVGSGVYSGNSYGLLIGYGNYSYFSDLSLHSFAKSHDSIADNKINIQGSHIAAFGNSADAVGSGNAYAILVGYGYALGLDERNLSIIGNALSVNATFLEVNGKAMTGDFSGNSYGMLLGYNNRQQYESSQFIVARNSLVFSKDYIISSTNLGDVGNAYGVNFGLNGELAELFAKNNLEINSTYFDIDGGGRDAWGIWMLDNSGDLQATNNHFAGNYGGGGHIKYPR